GATRRHLGPRGFKRKVVPVEHASDAVGRGIPGRKDRVVVEELVQREREEMLDRRTSLLALRVEDDGTEGMELFHQHAYREQLATWEHVPPPGHPILKRPRIGRNPWEHLVRNDTASLPLGETSVEFGLGCRERLAVRGLGRAK